MAWLWRITAERERAFRVLGGEGPSPVSIRSVRSRESESTFRVLARVGRQEEMRCGSGRVGFECLTDEQTETRCERERGGMSGKEEDTSGKEEDTDRKEGMRAETRRGREDGVKSERESTFRVL